MVLVSMCSVRRDLFLAQKYVSNYSFKVSFQIRCSSRFKNSLFLPRTNFPHKVKPQARRERDLMIEKEYSAFEIGKGTSCFESILRVIDKILTRAKEIKATSLNKKGKFDELYSWQQHQNFEKKFILHDGPPYANGEVHIGHAVNKVLKDITVRHKLLKGYEVNFVPGWDCHGLPIELKVLKESDSASLMNNALTVRRKALTFSQKRKQNQLSSFKDWGILADWSNNYFTCSPNYIVQQLNVFHDLHDKGIIFQDYKPVYWSPYNRTSLAEAELEYNPNHVSPSVYMKFSVTKCPDVLKQKLDLNSSLFAIIWTTTPWTIPANQLVCYCADKMYSLVKCIRRNEFYLMAQEMIPSVSSSLMTELQIIETFEGTLFKDMKYLHPMSKDQECPFAPAHHVTMTKGTGLVHSAPNHGLDDFIVAKKQHLSINRCLVDENGCYTDGAGEKLKGKAVLYDGSKAVLDLLNEDILYLEQYTHSYPYDWRSKTPVIIRSSHQWFIDVHQIRDKAMEHLQKVKIIPDQLKKQFLSQLNNSPQWCISRQRVWGVPIPAFYAEDKSHPIIHRAITDHLCSLIQKQGIHCWWELDLDQLLPHHLRIKCNLQDQKYRKCSDIMDIWFDSGISWKCVLPEPQISDVCIEGVDQIRGWFNSSLLTSVALREKAPYKTLVLHGFTTDADGRKMSKSEGNVISPADIISGSKDRIFPAFGVDVLRWWIASHACQHDNIAVKIKIIEECAENLNKIRNTFKFLLGCLDRFDDKQHSIHPRKMRFLDLYMLHQLQNFYEKVMDEYDTIQYKSVSKDILNFVTNEVSSFYCQIIKDRLYCEAETSTDRYSCQTVLYFLLNTLLQCIGPINPHLVQEVVFHHPDPNFAKQNAFSCQWPVLKAFLGNTSLPRCITTANQIRETVLKSGIKTINKKAVITGGNKTVDCIKDMSKNFEDNTELIELFQVAEISFDQLPENLFKEAVTIIGRIEEADLVEPEPFSVILIDSKLEKCSRCRRYSSTDQSLLCKRCENVVNENV